MLAFEVSTSATCHLKSIPDKTPPVQSQALFPLYGTDATRKGNVASPMLAYYMNYWSHRLSLGCSFSLHLSGLERIFLNLLILWGFKSVYQKQPLWIQCHAKEFIPNLSEKQDPKAKHLKACPLLGLSISPTSTLSSLDGISVSLRTHSSQVCDVIYWVQHVYLLCWFFFFWVNSKSWTQYEWTWIAF